jgi:hypothetical protein
VRVRGQGGVRDTLARAVRSPGTALAACLTVFVAQGAALPEARAQTDADRAAARAAATEGLRAFQEGRFQDAVDFCSRAEALMHAPTHLLLVARAQAKLGHLVEAQEAYFRIKRDHLAADAPRAFVDAQSSAADEQAALGPRIPTLKVTLEGAPAKDVTLTIDGQAVPSALLGLARPINPGQHTVAARSPEAESDTASVMVPEGAAQAVTLTLHPVAVSGTAPVPATSGPEPSPAAPERAAGGGHGLRVAGWISVGVGVVGAAVGTVFILKNGSDLNSANALCGSSSCPQSKRAQIDSLDASASQASTIAWVSYGVGVAGLGAGVAMLVMSGGKSAPPPQAAGLAGARPWVGPGSAGVTIAF